MDSFDLPAPTNRQEATTAGDNYYPLPFVASGVPPAHDYHVHSTYSDGRFLSQMTRAAEDAGLDGIGFADHCNVSTRDPMERAKVALGFNLDRTYERRRRAIENLRDHYGSDLAIFDAVEMDYDPRDEDEIESFLDDAAFDYAIGSVHTLEDVNVHVEPYFAKKSEDIRENLVDDYFDRLVALVESELFDIAAHVDLVERNPALRGYATRAQYQRVADAFERSSTVPELNAGRVLTEYGEFHPSSSFREVLVEHDVAFTVGSDSHKPNELRERTPVIEEYFDERGMDPVHVVN